VDIRVDANCGWKDPEVALRQISVLRQFGVSSIEEPLPPRDWDGLAYLTAKSSIPICVDESLTNAEDAHTLIARRACHMFNLRLSKCGGVFNFLRLADIASAAGLQYQVGCHVGETGILSAAGRHLFMALPNAVHAEGSFGRLLLQTDLTTPGVEFRFGGKAKRLKGAGLGVELRAPLDQFCTNYTCVRIGAQSISVRSAKPEPAAASSHANAL
jgi:L-alanine-DL-glutamate epimerase-like enolase superfamily enzyme